MSHTTKQEKLIARIKALRQKALDNGLKEKEVGVILHQSIVKSQAAGSNAIGDSKWQRKHFIRYAVLAVVLSFVIFCFIATSDPKCIIMNNLLMLELARPAVSCDLCKDMDQVPTVDGSTFTKELFLKEYAYNGIPLLIKGGAANWTALNTFNFKYLKDLFEQTEGALEAVEYECQFFPYKTSFLTLAEVFNMSEARSRLDDGEKQWYVGWSNCNSDVAKQLRKHYKRPEFLPDDSESSNLDWLFMGGFGGGANIHIDYVQRPSWQAMIAGKKSWKIIPSPECESICKTMNATMEKGDIILVDTNMWYHSTYIHRGEMSITIGSEYD